MLMIMRINHYIQKNEKYLEKFITGARREDFGDARFLLRLVIWVI